MALQKTVGRNVVDRKWTEHCIVLNGRKEYNTLQSSHVSSDQKLLLFVTSIYSNHHIIIYIKKI